MRLDVYLKKNGLTDEEFGSLVGLSQSYVNRLRRGEGRPSLGALERIRDRTSGEVTADDFMASADEAT